MAKRRLSNFNFEKEGSHIALVGPSVGGPANSVTTLITKSTADIKTIEVEKAAEVTVTMPMVDFLCKFFGLWYEDAIVLAAIFGYQDIDEAYSFEESANAYEEYLQERVDAVQIMKSLVLDKELEDIKKAIAELQPKDYLAILKAQEVFEKNFEEASEKIASLKKSSDEEGVTAEKSATSPSVENDNKEEDSMSEFVTKAALEAEIQKAVKAAVEEKEVQLQKALEEVAEFKKEKEEAVAKARKDAIAEVEKGAEKAEALFKSTKSLAQEEFEVIVKALEAKNKIVEDSDLFVQKSKNTEVPVQKEENGTMAILKAKYAQ